jgi:catechol 2,3-dioxygenase-like lactoylglutathione lyase family enzyme
MDPLLRKVDCVQIPVPDLDAGLRFYRDGLGLELKWRHATQAGLRLGDTELVVLLDLSKGTFQTGPDGTVTGVG